MGTAVKYIGTLGVALAAVAALAGAVGSSRWGAHAYESAAIAALINWIAGGAALAVIIATRTSAQRINGTLLAMGSRMVLPLAAIMFVTSTKHPLASQGVVGFILAFYLFGLLIETLMAVRLVGRPAPRDSSASSPSHIV